MIPRYIQTLFGLLSPCAGDVDLPEQEWRELLAFADRTQLTLHLHGYAGLPPWLEAGIESRRVRNLERRRRLREAFAEIHDVFHGDAVEFVLLKGFTHETGFGIDPEARVQYDLDLLCAPEDLAKAGAALRRVGYVPHSGRSLNDEHSKPWVQRSATDREKWTWRGDYFDPEIPISVEVHDTLWDSALDRIRVDTAAFWKRRSGNALAEIDRAGFAALHVLRHVLRQDARPAHTYELARLLQTQNEAFWRNWAEQHDPRLRGLEIVGFRFATEWFGCRLPEALNEEWLRQPETVKGWFRDFAWSPIANLARANKDAVWLHLALLENWSDRARVLCHRITPFRRPHAGLFNRLRYHAGALAPALFNGLRWWWRRRAASTASQISDWNRESV